MTEIVPVSGPELVTYADELAALLIESVEGGASVGFLASLDRTCLLYTETGSGSPGTTNGWPARSAW